MTNDITLDQVLRAHKKSDGNTAIDPNFTILYPNGTKEKPATIGGSQRIIVQNPFPGYYVEAVTELLINGQWGASHFRMWAAYAGIGVATYQVNDNEIVLVSGSDGVCMEDGYRFNIQPAPYSVAISSRVGSAPYRVKVWKLGAIPHKFKEDKEGPACVIDSGVNGSNWYRLWSDGWIEQGGSVPGAAGDHKFPLSKPFKNRDYFFNIDQATGSTDSYWYNYRRRSDGPYMQVYYGAHNENFYARGKVREDAMPKERKEIRIIETFHDPKNGNYYRIYEDGWIEQGGNIPASFDATTAWREYTFPLLKPMKDGNYFPQIFAGTSHAGGLWYYLAKNTDSIKIRVYCSMNHLTWKVFGYVDPAAIHPNTAPVYVVKSCVTHENYYRLYSDGWVEQGGCLLEPVGDYNANSARLIPLPIKMKGTYVKAINASESNNGTFTVLATTANDKPDSIYFHLYGHTSDLTFWNVCGMMAKSDVNIKIKPPEEKKPQAISHGEKVFTSNSVFVVPEGVTQIYVTAVAGGAGGGGGFTITPSSGKQVPGAKGNPGGNTSLGDLLVLSGGGGIGFGARGVPSTIPSGYGRGGRGGGADKGPLLVSGQPGRDGDYCEDKLVTVTPKQSLNVVIGTGGKGGAGGYYDDNRKAQAGADGQPGYMHIKW